LYVCHYNISFMCAVLFTSFPPLTSVVLVITSQE